MTQNKFANFAIPIIALLIGAALMYAFIPKGTEEKRALIEQKKITRHYIDSLELSRKKILALKITWLIINRQRRDSFNVVLEKSLLYQKNKYEKILHAPVVRYSEPQLDSIIPAIIR